MAIAPEIKVIHSDWKISGDTQEKDRVFDVKLTEDDVDMCVHAINELCKGFIKNDGISIRDARIKPYLELTSKLNRLFIDQK